MTSPTDTDRALAKAMGDEPRAAVPAKVRALLAEGASPRAEVDGCTALHRAAALLHGEAFALLVAAGGDLDQAASDRVHVGPDTYVARRATARTILDETLRAQVKSQDVEYEDVRAAWDAIAAAQGTTFDALVAGTKKKPAKKKVPKGESPLGTWTAITYCYESSPDGEEGYVPRDLACGPDAWELSFGAGGDYRSLGPYGTRSEGTFERDGAQVRFDGRSARWAASTDQLIVVTTDDEHGSDVTWTFRRVS